MTLLSHLPLRDLLLLLCEKLLPNGLKSHPSLLQPCDQTQWTYLEWLDHVEIELILRDVSLFAVKEGYTKCLDTQERGESEQ